MAVKLLTQRGIDLTGRHPKPVSAVLDAVNDLVVTIGDPAKNKLPRPMPGHPTIIHWDIADPADADGTPDSERVFRNAMEMIEARLPDLLMLAEALTSRSRVRRRPGATTGIWYPNRFEPRVHLPQLVTAGFTAIELNCFLGETHFPFRDARAVHELQQIASDLGVEIWSIHEPRTAAAIGSTDAASQRIAVDDLKLTIDLAAQLGAKAIPSHALLGNGQAPAIALDVLAELTPALRATGVQLAIENGYAAAAPVLAAFRQLPADAFGFVLDTGHANMAGGHDAIAHIIQTVGQRMISLHLNDNNGKTDSHHPPGGEGCNIDWPAVARLLQSVGYDGCYLWEVFSKLGDRSEDSGAVMARTMDVSRQCFHPSP